VLEVEEAIARILERVRPLAEETVPLLEAQGTFLAREVVATRALPPFDNSSMDGYGVRVADVACPPARLRVIGESRAGGPAAPRIGSGEAIRILTGAPVSEGVEAVVKQEDVLRTGDEIEVKVSVVAGNDVRRSGDDVREGDVVLGAGARVGPGEIGLLAALGFAQVVVRRRPRVAILSTGDELVEIGQAPGPGQIVASNGVAVAAQARAAGAVVIPLGIAVDEERSIAARIDEGRAADMLLTSGGVSVGDHDLVRKVLGDLGWTSEFWKVRMKPGKPVAFGMLGAVAVLGLPGNPASAMVTFAIFGRPAIRKMLGDPAPVSIPTPATLGAAYEKDDARRHYLRCRTERPGSGDVVLRPAPKQGSGMLTSMAGMDALGVVDGPAGRREAGSRVLRLPLD